MSEQEAAKAMADAIRHVMAAARLPIGRGRSYTITYDEYDRLSDALAAYDAAREAGR